MKKLLIISLILACIALGLSLWWLWYILHPVNPVLSKSSVQIANTKWQVEISDTALTRARGLSGRSGLEANTGMLFIFPTPDTNGFWMKDMLFPLDIIWVKDNKVVGLEQNVLPEPEKTLLGLTIYYPPSPINYVLEVSAGSAAKYNLRVGDSFSFVK